MIFVIEDFCVEAKKTKEEFGNRVSVLSNIRPITLQIIDFIKEPSVPFTDFSLCSMGSTYFLEDRQDWWLDLLKIKDEHQDVCIRGKTASRSITYVAGLLWQREIKGIFES